MSTTSKWQIYSGGIIYGATLVLSSALMFFVEPYAAKVLLPLLGGGPAVWNTCVCYFQLVLLLGYMYAHWLSKQSSLARQLFFHALIIWLPAVLLLIQPPTITDTLRGMPGFFSGVGAETQPILWLLLTLTCMIGGMFFAISTTAPLLQKWYTRSRFSGSSDPYFLFAASNFGGLAGLLLYPFLIEPNLPLAQQANGLSVCYLAVAIMVSLSGLLVYRSSEHGTNATSEPTPPEPAETPASSTTPSRTAYARWLLLSAIPSSLVLGLTTHVTSELSSIPLFWIVPLALYLVSFIITFGRCPATVIRFVKILAPCLVACSVMVIASDNGYLLVGGGEAYITTGIALQLLTLLAVCVACHGQIAQQRPSPAHLTAFYFIISLGGVLGSAFNTLVAPTIFRSGHEYLLVLLLAGVTVAHLPSMRRKHPCSESTDSVTAPAPDSISGWSKEIPFVIPMVVLGVTLLCWFGYALMKPDAPLGDQTVRPETGVLELVLRFVAPLVVCMLLSRKQAQFKLGLASICTVVILHVFAHDDEHVVFRNRNFFGQIAVATFRDTAELWNGANLHGTESLNPVLRGKPEAYLYTDGPIGKLLDYLSDKERQRVSGGIVPGEEAQPEALSDAEKRQLFIRQMQNAQFVPPPYAVMGLGTGVASALAKPGQTVAFFEINPQVVEIARNPFFFTYLYEARKRKVNLRIIKGDARTSIQKEPSGFYQLIIGDAFNSSSIPSHLITRDAIQIYLRKLKPGGALAFNTTGYFDLKPVLAKAAEELNLRALTIREYDRDSDSKYFIEWVVLTPEVVVAKHLESDGWKVLSSDPGFRLWTDDYANPLGVLRERFTW